MQHLIFNFAVFLLFIAGCGFMVWRSRRRLDALRRESDRLDAEIQRTQDAIEAERARQRRDYALPDNVVKMPREYVMNDPRFHEIAPGIVVHLAHPPGPRRLDEDEK